MVHRRTLILAGGGDFSDPWHPFAATASRIAGICRGLGHEVEVSTAVVDGMLGLAGDGGRGAAPDLVIVNAGNAELPTDGDAAAIQALSAYLRGGGALIATHVSATAFPAVDDWERIIGGRWVRGTTMHPDEGAGRVRVVPGHPIAEGVSDFQVYDELYSWMRVADDVDLLATHRYQDVDHPLSWAHEVDGARVVYDALGHTPRSYDAADHVRLVEGSIRWVLRED